MILSGKNRKCSTKEAALRKEPHRGQTLPTCWLQYYWQRSWCQFFVQFDMPVFDMVIMLGSWETFWWRNAISACCVSLTNLPTFWTNIFLGFMERVRQIIFWPTFSPIPNCTNMFGWYWSTRWPTYWRSLSPFISLWTQDFTTDFWWDSFPNHWFLIWLFNYFKKISD